MVQKDQYLEIVHSDKALARFALDQERVEELKTGSELIRSLVSTTFNELI